MARHCESCGQKNPKTEDGYTVCCGELVCNGGNDRFGTPENFVRACCWAIAEQKFAAKGIKINDEMYRL